MNHYLLFSNFFFTFTPIYSTAGHNITPYFSMKMYNASKHVVRVLCEGLRHEIQLVGSKIKVSVCKNYEWSEVVLQSRIIGTVRVRIIFAFFVFRFTLIHYLSSYGYDGVYDFKPSVCMFEHKNCKSNNTKTY